MLTTSVLCVKRKENATRRLSNVPLSVSVPKTARNMVVQEAVEVDVLLIARSARPIVSQQAFRLDSAV